MRPYCFVIVLLTLLTAGCSRQTPQRPSQRMGAAPEVDSTQLALLEMNQQLAAAADRRLLALAQSRKESYALYDNHTWCTILVPGDTDCPSPKRDDECTLHMRMYDTEGRLLEDSERTYRVGKQELPLAVETIMSDLHPGARARLLAPWYAAFGMQGNEHIPPYQNLIIDLELK